MFQRFFSLLYRIIPFLGFCIVVISCNSEQDRMSDEEYLQTINEWHEQRIESLQEEDSWLSLAGLYRIEKGEHAIGSDSTNDIILPERGAPYIGTIVRKEDSLTFFADPEASVTSDGEPISEINLQVQGEHSPTKLRHNDFIGYVIERRGDYYLRLKDTKHPNFSAFDGIDRFPVDRKWSIKATFKRFESPRTITIPDILGESYEDSLYGTLHFTIKDQKYQLAPLGHPDKDEQFFIIFGDETNGKSTYDGGRYLYVDTPNKNNVTYIDFNKAYNPPCVFTDYATCPLPPLQNRLPVAITAGEKNIEIPLNKYFDT